MIKHFHIPTNALLRTLFIRFFSSRYTIVIFDLVMTTIISVYVSTKNMLSIKDVKLIVYVTIQVIINILCIFAGNYDQKEKNVINNISKAYNIHNNIDFDTAGKLYEANNIISQSIQEKKIEKNTFNEVFNFQKLSLEICSQLYTFIASSFGCDECEISVFQRFTQKKHDFVKMIAYKNKNNVSSTFGKSFELAPSDNPVAVFIKIFNDKNAIIKTLHNHETIEEEFVYFKNSINREEKICQYIGIPIKTKRDKIELLLQIDVSKEKVLGKNNKELRRFAEEIILPFSNLLYCSYERELILNKFYDILEENLPQKEQ